MHQLSKVFHGSPTQHLQELLPNASTHRQPWVYAALDPVIAATFLSNTGGDFTCAVGREGFNGQPFLCERFPNAFEERYPRQPGSIYILPQKGFTAAQTDWQEEAVACRPVQVLKEIQIPSIREFLLYLQETGKLTLYRYPDRPPAVPADDADLLERAERWLQDGNQAILPTLRQFHPTLLQRMQQTIHSQTF